ncbi:MAG TPA: homocysteine S-methyltransferase family protein [Kiritimatiellia bacterium]|jgi:5-methyltetrahydrofolate--homocysteine methyltransferase|nr:homocysteine S-methyltransferase family protein [Kiritimatiellia bacterium]HOM58311.1 homocysteine S-methyltransferase family protein [Kiritimatiellia bacterium]HOR97792.1 homocysteine S-methyltransferase family protein [Kiritimatiellia bacterium]HPC49074.1 homocysteine S-methyltransferase family protein [Kiritimatiellia bacterium]HPK37051.1 homocysteine S-methyltransferase family protein [Kiritimatiellia bacterium]
MQRLEERVQEGVLVCDGAMGTELHRLGLAPGECPEQWCLDHPEKVRAVHQAYREAGSAIVETNTFGGNRYKLAHYGLESAVEAINRAGAALAREVAGDTQWVMASLGPTGVFLEPYGEESEQAFYDAFAAQARAFEAGGADAVVVETMMAVEECCVAVRAVRENTRLTCIASFTFDPQPDGGYASMMGVTPEQFAAQAQAAGAQILGANCGTGTDHMIAIIRRLRAVAGVPLIAMPNAGMPMLVRGETVFPETPDEMAAQVGCLVEAGASIVGGCCGTTPAHIAAIAAALNARR